ncbi:MAG TPA: DUF1579 domain-containing protein [Patescibacteria group bacterium]|nr:DUF1579 domain-containing protein [Patescibacteria group bacterium]
MNRRLAVHSLPLYLAMALPAWAGDAAPTMPPEAQAMMDAFQKAGTPGPQHERMAKQAGAYVITIKSWSAPGAPPTTDQGKVTRRMLLGGRVMIEESEAAMGGQPFSGVGLSGFDNVSGKFWSTWNDSMGTGLMVAEGDCDDRGSCTFHGSWNDPITKGKTHARMTTTWTDANTEVFAMFIPGPDGKDMLMMEITYRRTP